MRQKLTLVSMWYQGKYHSAFMMAEVNSRGDAKITREHRDALLREIVSVNACPV